MTVIFPPAILGPKMAAPLYGRLAFFGSFCSKTPVPIKFLVLGEGGGRGFFWKGGGVGAPILFLWAWGFCDLNKAATSSLNRDKAVRVNA